MPINALQRLVDSKLQQRKISPDDTREVLEKVRADKKFDANEVKQLKRLAALPASRFERKDEFFPNPSDPDDGVTIKANPKKWVENTIQLATAKLSVKSTVPGISFKLSGLKEFDDDDFGSHLARTLDVTVTGATASKAGPIEFTYGDRSIKVEVKKDESIERVVEKLESALLKKEGALSVDGWFNASKPGKQTIKFEVL